MLTQSQLENMAPAEGRHICVCAASYLTGRALIVGGGEFITARAAQLHKNCWFIDVVEINQALLDYAPPGVNVIHADILKWDPQPHAYDSIHWDPWPPSNELKERAGAVREWLASRGRVVFVNSAYTLEDFGPGYELVNMDRPGPHAYSNERVVVLRRDPECQLP